MTKRSPRGTRARAAAASEAPEPVRREWLRRVEAEYGSAAITGQLVHWLIQLAAPPALIRQGLRIVADELRHAELSDRVYRAAGGMQAAALSRERLQLARSEAPLEHDVTRIVLQVYCLGETAAVRLFHRLRAACSVPVARVALDRVLRDEVRHREFGWLALQWLLDLPDAATRRSEIQRALPQLLAGLRANYGGHDAPEPQRSAAALPASVRAWGLMVREDYRKAIELCVERDLRPRFERLDILLPA